MVEQFSLSSAVVCRASQCATLILTVQVQRPLRVAITVNDRIVFPRLVQGLEILTEADAIQLQLHAILGEKEDRSFIDRKDFEEMAP